MAKKDKTYKKVSDTEVIETITTEASLHKIEIEDQIAFFTSEMSHLQNQIDELTAILTEFD